MQRRTKSRSVKTFEDNRGIMAPPRGWRKTCSPLYDMLLKPRLAHNIAGIFGGAFVAFIGFASAIGISSSASVIPAIFGIFGSLLIFAGGLGLARRSRLAIT